MKKQEHASISNRPILAIAYFFMGLFVLMIGYLIYFQTFRSEEFINSPYNTLQNLFAERVERGEIVSSDGVILAKSVKNEEGEEERVYPYGELFAHVTGYAVKGRAGLESIANFRLLRSHQFFLDQIRNDLDGRKNLGDRVIATVDFDLQETAYRAMGDYNGAVVAIEPQTGRILCLVSKPVYDPNNVLANWDAINQEGNTQLFNRATQGLYAPGSTFKIFTALEYYHEHKNDYEAYFYDCSGDYTRDGITIHCAGNHRHGEQNLLKSFSNSCNCSFANIGMQIDPKSFSDLCGRLLFNQKLPASFLTGVSSFPLQEEPDTEALMHTAMGQGDTVVSPLHMAMISSAVSNGGTLMKPQLIERVENYEGILVKKMPPQKYKTLLSEEDNSLLRLFMREVITDGTGKGLKDSSYVAYGKTGTAQTTKSLTLTNAWFTGFAEYEGRSIAIAVILEDAGAGNTKALPVAKAVFDCYFSQDVSCE